MGGRASHRETRPHAGRPGLSQGGQSVHREAVPLTKSRASLRKAVSLTGRPATHRETRLLTGRPGL